MPLEDLHLDDLSYGFSNHTQPITLDDIERVTLGISDDSDEPNFTWVVKLREGSYSPPGGVFRWKVGRKTLTATAGPWAALRGWHDYTGWDCVSGLTIEFYPTEEAALNTLVEWERDEVERRKKRNTGISAFLSGETR